MKRTSGFWAIGLWALLWSIRTFAQPLDVAFEHYTSDQGLSNDIVTSILKDRQGFLWVGTVNGLNRFDGTQFRVFKRTGKPDGLPGNYVIDITEDPQGFLWVATHRGMCRLDPQRLTFESLLLPANRDQRSDNDYISGVVFDQQGMGWFSTLQNLYRIDPRTRKLTAYPTLPKAHQRYCLLTIDRKNRLWVVNEGALYRFEPKTGTYTYLMGRDIRHRSSDVEVSQVYESSSGELWLPSWKKELYRFSETTQQFKKYADMPTPIGLMEEDRTPSGRSFFWMDGGKEDIQLYDPATKQTTEFTNNARDLLSHNGRRVGALYREPQTGIVWIGTESGLEKVDSYAIKFGRKVLPVKQDGSPFHDVKAIQQDRTDPNTYWIGVAGEGLYRWHRPTNSFTAIQDQLPNREVMDIAQDASGKLWLALYNDLAQWDPARNQWKSWPHFLTSKNNGQSVRRLLADRQNRIWIGANMDGLFVYEPQTNQIRPWSLGVPSGATSPLRVYTLQEDRQGFVWVSTSAGIFYIHPTTAETKKVRLWPQDARFQTSDNLQTTFFIDSKNRLWASGIGFLVQADRTGHIQQTYALDNGLEADHIFAIREDKQGHLWLATDSRLHELDPTTGNFRYFGKESGLLSNAQQVYLEKNTDGELFVTYASGFNHFDPAQLRTNKLPPPVVLTGLRVNNTEWQLDSIAPLVLKPSENTLSFEFAALNFSQPQRNQYAYQLVGVDKEWIYTPNRLVTYANLEPGNYTFRVRAANNDGVWNENGVELAIRVLPPYWQTWWFRLTGVLLLAGIAYAIYQNRQAQRQRLEAIRNRIATDLHDDMGSTLSSIRIFSDVVQQQIAPVRPEAVPILQRISSSATTLSESMQDIIWTIQTRYDSLDDVVTRMREFGLRMAEAKDIQFKMQVSNQFETTRLNVEQRRNLYLIFKESVNNAVKYAASQQINVALTVINKLLTLSIEDNGCGFDQATVSPGNGLPNLAKRAREINGELTIHSAPGAGTRIVLLVRIK